MTGEQGESGLQGIAGLRGESGGDGAPGQTGAAVSFSWLDPHIPKGFTFVIIFNA